MVLDAQALEDQGKGRIIVEANRAILWAPPTPARDWPSLNPANDMQNFTLCYKRWDHRGFKT